MNRILQSLLLVMIGAQLWASTSIIRTPSVTISLSGTYTSTAYYLYVRNDPDTCTSGPAKYIKKAYIKAELYFDGDYNYGNTAFTDGIALNYTVSGFAAPIASSGTQVFQYPQILGIYGSTYTAPSGTVAGTSPESHGVIDFTGSYNSVNAITINLANNPVINGLKSDIRAKLKLRVYLVEEILYDVSANSVTLSPITSTVTSNPTTFSWSPGCAPSANYQLQVLRLYNINRSYFAAPTSVSATVNWNEALSIETGNSANSFTLTLAEGSGYYIWRVRPIGNYYPGGIADSRNWGIWSDHTSYGTGAVVNITSATSKTFLFYYQQFDEDKNWTFSRAFVEGDYNTGKQLNISEGVSYFSSLLMPKQGQARSNEDGKLIMSQTVQDHSGRNALTSLAAPLSGITFSYQNAILQNTAGTVYNATDFDNNNNYINTSSSATNSTCLVSSYYSNANPDVNIPSADNFPFVRTLFYGDGTGRMREISQPGSTHTVGSDHTGKVFYSSCTNAELINLFGDEAPGARSVYKQLSKDGNGRYVLNYIGRDGKIIATGLSQSSGTMLATLNPSLSLSDTLNFDDFSIVDDYTVKYTRSTAFNSPVNLTLNYSITPASYSTCIASICRTCDYEVTFTIYDVNDPATPVYSNTVLYAPFNTCTASQSILTASQSLDPGSYIIQKTVKANTTAPSGDTYFDEGKEGLYQALFNKYYFQPGFVIETAKTVTVAALDTALANSDLEKFRTLVGVISTYSTLSSVRIMFGCDTLTIPVPSCPDVCGSMDFESYYEDYYNITNPDAYQYLSSLTGTREELLSDFIGINQYRTITSSASSDGYLDYLPMYKPGEFNAVIASMVTDGYDCEALWNAWRAVTVNGGENFGSYFGEDRLYDLLEDFLDRTDYKLSSTVHLRTAVDYTASSAYTIQKPYKYLHYDKVRSASDPKHFGPYNMAVETKVVYGSNSYNNWYANYTVAASSDPTYGSKPVVPNTPTLINTMTSTYTTSDWKKFLDECRGNRQTKFTSTASYSQMDAITGDLKSRNADSCKQRCQEREPVFKSAIVKAYQTNYVSVQGVFYPNITPAVTTIASSIVAVQTQNVVDYCKKTCSLTVFSHTASVLNESGTTVTVTLTDSVGTQNQSKEIIAWLTNNIDAQLPFGDGSCASDYIKIGGASLADMSEVIEDYLNEQLLPVTNKAPASGMYWNYRSALDSLSASTLSAMTSGSCLSTSTPSVYVHPNFHSSFDLVPYNSASVKVSTFAVSSPFSSLKYEYSGSMAYSDVTKVKLTLVLSAPISAGQKVTINDSIPQNGYFTLYNGNMTSFITTLGTQTIVLNYFIKGIKNLTAGVVSTPIIFSRIALTNGIVVTKISNTATIAYVTSVTTPGCYSILYNMVPKNMVPKVNSADSMNVVSPSTVNISTDGFSYRDFFAYEPDVLRDSIVDSYFGIMDFYFCRNFLGFSPRPSVTLTPQYLNNVYNFRDLYHYKNDSIFYGTGNPNEYIILYNYVNPVWVTNICGYYCPGTATSIPICVKLLPLVPSYADTISAMDCADLNSKNLRNSLGSSISSAISANLNKYVTAYQEACISSAGVNDLFKVNYITENYLFTLMYYDRAGNLVKTIAPKGVTEGTDRLSHPTNSFVTEYAYNSLGLLIRKKTPDGGETKFYYDNKGRTRFSQGAQQLAEGKFSYVKYDDLGRISEAGVCTNSININLADDNTYPATNLSERALTVYSQSAAVKYLDGTTQRYLQNRISYAMSDKDGNTATIGDQVTSYYSYDPHGNVEWVIQYMPDLGYKYVRYSYDLLTGLVNKMCLNEGQPDQFYQRLTYDENKRIKYVETSRDNIVWDRDAQYTYYPHGPLKRVVMGDDKLQGLDYVYTIQGWLKGMNHPSLDTLNDPSHDGSAASQVAKDAYGFALGYYDGDFSRTYSSVSSAYNNGNTYLMSPGGNSLYNGMITSMSSRLDNDLISHVGGLTLSGINGRVFSYDELYRLNKSDFSHQDVGSSSYSTTGSFDETFSYDYNGNITAASRNYYHNKRLDYLGYNYTTGTNRLTRVTDTVISSVLDDIENQSINNYTYDASGRLTKDALGAINTIAWNAGSKTKSIATTGGTFVFTYDALGNRVKKEMISLDTLSRTCTYYLYGSTGLLAIYERNDTRSSGGSTLFSFTLRQREIMLSGGKRLGTWNANNRVLHTGTYSPTSYPLIPDPINLRNSARANLYIPTMGGSGVSPGTLFVDNPAHIFNPK